MMNFRCKLIIIIQFSCFGLSSQASSLIRRFETPQELVYPRGMNITLQWIYKLPTGRHIKLTEFFCGYRNRLGRVFPLALDKTGHQFITAGFNAQPNFEVGTDDKLLLHRSNASIYFNGSEMVRRIDLQEVDVGDEGRYFCGLAFTDPISRVVFGGEVTLRCNCPTPPPPRQSRSTRSPSWILAVSITCPVVVLALLVAVAVYWRKRTRQLQGKSGKKVKSVDKKNKKHADASSHEADALLRDSRKSKKHDGNKYMPVKHEDDDQSSNGEGNESMSDIQESDNDNIEKRDSNMEEGLDEELTNEEISDDELELR